MIDAWHAEGHPSETSSLSPSRLIFALHEDDDDDEDDDDNDDDEALFDSGTSADKISYLGNIGKGGGKKYSKRMWAIFLFIFLNCHTRLKKNAVMEVHNRL